MIQIARYSGAAIAALLAALVDVRGQPALYLQHEDGRIVARNLGDVLLRVSLECEPPRPPDSVVLVFETEGGALLVWHMDLQIRAESRELAPLAFGERVVRSGGEEPDGIEERR